MLDRTKSFHGIQADLEHCDDTDREPENPYEEYRRLVQEQTQALANLPGRHGRRMRIALNCGWC